MKKLKWCFRLRRGIRMRKPSEEISRSYLELARLSLKNAEVMLERDLLWTTVMIYYAEYYALYSFLAKIGVKCENHFCSILLVKFLLGEKRTELIERHREKRIDAQYYLRVERKNDIKNMLNEAKFFVADFEELISNLSEREVEEFRKKIKNFIRV